MKTDSQFYHTEGSVRLNLLEAGKATLQCLWMKNTPHLVTDLQSGPESGPVARFCRHQTNFYLIITIT